MRYLFLAVGAPASGKSTFIKKHKLGQYSISTDDIREMVSTKETKIADNGNLVESIDMQDESYTWKILRDMIERRMSQGETTIVDATHLFKGAFGQYTELVNKWNYKLVLIDFMKPLFDNVSQIYASKPKEYVLNQLIANDNRRGVKIPYKSVFNKYLDRYLSLKEQNFNSYKVVSPEEFINGYIKENEKPLDMNEFTKIKIIGDVHGDASSLKKVFDDHKRGYAYIFVGDYLDRGTDNAGVFKFIKELKGKNIFLLRGNHEWRMESFTADGVKKAQFGKETLEELFKSGVTTEDMKEFQERLGTYMYITFRGKKYFISHAGIEFNRSEKITALTNESELVMGLSEMHKSPYDRDVDDMYLEHNTDGVINVHGHRNEFHHKALETKNGNTIANLTEYGKFRYIELSDEGIKPFDEDRIDEVSFVDSLFSDKDVKENNVPGTDIVAHNFTKEVFQSGDYKRWTPRTLSARGLFTKGDDIVGRGFTKFFNVGETPTATLDSLVYPVNIYHKWNGFLGISFYDKSEGKVNFVTKGGYKELPTVDEKDLIRNVVTECGYLNLVTEYLEENPNNSVLFEIITPEDEHIIDYSGWKASVPIAVINNDTGKPVTADEQDVFDIKPLATVYNKEQLEEYINKVNKFEDPIEGVVLRGQNKMLKVKTPFYLKAKELRGRLSLYKAKGAKKFHESGYDTNESKWYYGAHEWFNRAVSEGEEFSPRLALKYLEQDNGQL